jgi:cytochrome c oxidase cbb3-type subunit 4
MTMDIEWMRSMMTVMAFATFVGIVAWAWSARKRNDFEVAARSVLEDDDFDAGDRSAMNTRGSGHE